MASPSIEPPASVLNTASPDTNIITARIINSDDAGATRIVHAGVTYIRMDQVTALMDPAISRLEEAMLAKMEAQLQERGSDMLKTLNDEIQRSGAEFARIVANEREEKRRLQELLDIERCKVSQAERTISLVTPALSEACAKLLRWSAESFESPVTSK
ncbi:hypothetical protein K474DRAFT_1678932 [Panus rudis PR-1116 ss-1]|nr:hypothetical protein K474DRAFT_1678932 [Panus rudis PR-1116 ss-1]